jgi:hypothetical protein
MSTQTNERQTAESAQEQEQEQVAGHGASGQQRDWAPLLAEADVQASRGRWEEIQASFVDRPRDSVEQADALVAELLQRLTAGFAQQRSRLEEQWEGGDDVSTEELRVALTRYRSFFNRLLAA